MLSIAVQPPARARPGAILYPPLVVQLSSEHDLYEHLAGYWTCITLIHYSTGQVIYDQMDGKAADSAHPIAQTRSRGVRDQAYFFFPDVAIHATGRYRLRISLMRMDYSPESGPDGAVVCDEQVDTRSITVEESGPNYSRPNSQERAFIRMLRDDGQDVPTPAH
ncbi:hypothetical protein MFRU_018g01410 [Monilinia fructicola]|uniref:Velvet domain-containing protein n=1 Tax=Monilinia fructicola TaxID=38448 RepID=A0A5M9JW88_MONFR|nr:hypothetical protein EYC84_002061 [Monilinia fructicola]KAG4029036.1 hypothetical protein MFRU_018g01410 [Monilinia fructicola]